MVNIEEEYFEWICNLICDRGHSKLSYKKLLLYLYDKQFNYIIEMDGNRAADGEDLRYRFGYICGYNDNYISSELDNKPCSVLEMMVALALRCEEHIMEDTNYGDRTSKWFWGMIDSLGLSDMYNDRFNLSYANVIMNRFMNRNYDRNGRGGLFTVKNPEHDMRSTEIWYQMCMYLNTFV